LTISFGKNPIPPSTRPWARSMGFSWADWLDKDGLFLNQIPELGRQYMIRLPANFVAVDLNSVTFHWLPADSAQNGFDEANIAELAELRFVTGRVSPTQEPEQAILFVPDTIESPKDLLALDCKPVVESDTLMDCQRYDYSFEQFRYVEFSMEGDVTSQYIFLDSQLVMLEFRVWHNAHFWIGNGNLSPLLAKKILMVGG